MAHDVFISYSASDKAVADAACATLESRKIRCWIAPRDVLPGMPYAEALIDAINRSRIMVLVFSASANGSPQVMREVERAVNKGIPIIPFRIEDVTPSKAMEYYLSTPHWLDALTPPLEKHLRRLADTIQVLLTTELEKLRAPSTERELEPPTPKPHVKIEWLKKVKWVYILTGSVVIALIVVGVIFLTGGFGRLPNNVSPIPPSNNSTPSLTPSGNVSIIKELNVPLTNINGITWDGTDLWMVTNSGDLFKMNTHGDVLVTCRSPEVTPEGLTWDGEAFWVFTTNYSYIYRFSIDESGAKLEVRTLSFFKSPNEIIGGTNDGLAWDGTNLWYSDRYSVHKLDIEGNVLGGFAFVHEIAGLCWDGEYLWLAYNDATLAQVDTEGKILHSFESPVSPVSALTWAEGYLWAVVSDPFADESKIYALEPQTATSVSEGHEVVTSVESTGFLALYSARGIAWDGTYLWLTDVSSGQMLKMTPDGETLDTYLSPAINPLGLTWDGAAFWIFDSEKNEICQFTLDEPGDVPQIQTLNSFAAPQSQDIGGTNGGLAWGGTCLWYSDRYNIYKLDSKGNVLKTMKLPYHIRGLTWDGEYLWLAYDSYPSGNTLAKIDSEGNMLLSFGSGAYTVYDLAWGNGYMWELGESRSIGTDTLSSKTMVYKTTWSIKKIRGS